MEKLIIYAAVGYPRQTANPVLPAVPRTWDELVDAAVAAHEAGASIVHFHGPHDDKGRIIPERWGDLVHAIRRRCDVLIDFGQAGAPLDQRKPLLNLGADKPDFMAVSLTNHDYRRRSPERGEFDVYYQHPRDELEEYAHVLAAAGVKPAWEIWHLGGVWNLNHLIDKGLVAKPYWLNLFFGTPGGVWAPPTVEEITHRIANLPPDAPFLLAPRGTAGPMGQTRMLTLGIIKGGHVRLGTQDIAYYADGVPAQSNAQIVARIARISRELGRDIATPDDARRILGLPGRTSQAALRG
jgi:3-keto-5-aminohexanoate cleavage enzyme